MTSSILSISRIAIQLVGILFMINLFSCNSLNGMEIIQGGQQGEFGFIEPKTIIADPINGYSVLHFIQYGLLSLIRIIRVSHVLIISLTWEFMELFIPNDWARESWANKLFDVFFNHAGFFFGRKTCITYKSKKSIST